MEELTNKKGEFRILLLVVFSVILIVALSLFVIGQINSHRFSFNEKSAIVGVKRICALEIGYESAFRTFTDDKTELQKSSGGDEPFLTYLVDKDYYHGLQPRGRLNIHPRALTHFTLMRRGL